MAEHHETPTAFTEDDLVSLGRKLAALDLTDGERAAMAELMSDNDVGGFGRARFDIVSGIRKGFRVPGVRVPGVRVPGAESISRDDDFGPGLNLKPGRF